MEVPSENSTTLKAERETKNHCPFGCSRADLDDNGYCHHLLGFTNDGVVVERIGRMRGHTAVFHAKKPKDRVTVQAGDVLVNPQDEQKIGGVTYLAKRWASSRVYRDLPKPAPVEDDDYPEAPAPRCAEPDDRVAALEAQVSLLTKQLAAKAAPKRSRTKKPVAAPAAS